MKIINFWKLFFTLFLVLPFITACDDEDESPAPEAEVDTEIFLDDYQANDMLTTMANMGTSYTIAAIDEGGRLEEGCPEVTHQVLQTRVLIDFGEGCQDEYGNTHSGRWVIDYSLSRESLSDFTIATENYQFNGLSVAAIVSFSAIEIGAGTFSVDTEGTVSLTFNDGATFSRTGSYTLSWQSGFGDQNPDNDRILTTGSGGGTNRSGDSFSYTIVEPLVRNTACAGDLKFVTVSGIQRIEPARSGSYTVNYGNGECDRSVTITTANRTFVIDLPTR